MTTFESRYKHLNTGQRRAVDTIDGPLLVIAGPGTGKTELLSMRAANILRLTDTLPENILCLTFTDSGANAMRQRLSDIIGPDAYKVNIQTFHSFGTETTNQNRQYFYQGAEFQPADDLSRYEILTSIFDELDYSNPLASKLNGEYTHLRDAMVAISELKQAGLTSDELLAIINANETTLDAVEADFSHVFTQRISTSTMSLLVPLAEKVATLPLPQLPPTIMPLADELAKSLAHSFDTAVATGKTTPVTAWRNQWLEKDANGTYVFKSRKRHAKLRALAQIYFSYHTRMEQVALYDYDDMILNVVHGMEVYPDLKANLQEKYHYIMVDEFQDTNLAQLRILFNLTDNPMGDAPNIMAVGDDDQAIYSFQGADANNIENFRQKYPDYKSLVLTQNYRSSQPILDHSREVITQASNRLEDTLHISKQLAANTSFTSTTIDVAQFASRADEYSWVAAAIADQIKQGAKASDITILARRHSELTEIIPYLHHQNIALNYERRDNVLEMEPIKTLELLANTTAAVFSGNHELADSYLPELLSHPMYGIPAETIWRLSLAAHRNSLSWLETMMVTPELKPLADWLIERARAVPHEPLEQYIDVLVGVPDAESDYHSPYYEYYFGQSVLTETPDAYITVLEALRTLRTKLREYQPGTSPHIADFLEFIRMHRQLGTTITSIRSSSTGLDNAINVMTAHKSKGLEFDTVYLINSVDSMWGERVRSRSRLISFPENLPITPNTDTYDERLRLYYVAMTRAKRELYISYSTHDQNEKDTLAASFLAGTTLEKRSESTVHTIKTLTDLNEIAWHDTLTTPTDVLRDLLAPTLERYKLSATHLNNFIDITRGGPRTFLMNNLLRFPQAKSANAAYGTAIHATLQRAHNHLVATGERRPAEDVLGDFIHELEKQRLNEQEFALFSKRGTESLAAFLRHHYTSFTRTQKTELSFANQNANVGVATLTGSLDLIDIKDNTMTVTDYKTGRPSADWKGKTDAEKVKLHKYKQQLMFYQLLTEHSRDYAKYTFERGVLQFVEPDARGAIHALEQTFTTDELMEFSKLITAVWHCITNLDFPDTNEFEASYKGVLAFEQSLIDKYS